MKVSFELNDGDFVARHGIAVIAGWDEEGKHALRLVALDSDSPVWVQRGLLTVALERVEENTKLIWPK